MPDTSQYEYQNRLTHQLIEVCPACKVHVVQSLQGEQMYCYHCGWRGEEGIYYVLRVGDA